MGINIKFANVNYRVQDGKQTKILLNDISGEFRAGELSAVIGPSGCGKTTLLNLLAGYGIQTNSGCVYINDKPQNAKEFGQKSRYVLQHDDISPHFTVWETMMFASNFKLSHRCSRAQKEKVIYENLEKFHMSGKINSIMTKLSGGERKRISIAMEVMDNPPILFLDEPITGLDEFSATQCLRILKQLANCGHTIVCSLHCPSARLLQMVNKVYAMANGECIYQGRVDNIVPFLNDLNLNCPLTHNPTDFIIEVATKSYGEYQRIMVDKISNGHIYEWLPKKSLDLGIIDVRKVEILHLNDNMQLSPSSLELSEEMLPWFKEYNILFIRFMQQMWRDMTNVKLRIAAYIVCCTLGGLNFIEIGRNAEYAIYYYPLALAIMLLFGFLGMVPIIANVPREMEVMRREHFNRWYRLSSYFMAMLTSQLPLLCPMSIIGSALLYFITGQPMELYRFTLFSLTILLVSLMAASFGLLLGVSFKSLYALFAGPIFILIMSIFGHQRACGTDLSTLQEFVIVISYMTYAIEGVMFSLLDNDRANLPCPSAELFCLTTKPKFVLKLLGYNNMNFMHCVLVLSGLTIFFTLMAYVVLKIRLNFRRKSKK